VPTIVIPFTGAEGKTRLHASRRARRALSLAMLGDVLAAATAVGSARVVTADAEGQAIAHELGAGTVEDPGGGQGPAVAAGLATLEAGPLGVGAILVVNADVPCVVPADLRALLAATPAGGIAFVEALDGTTNALSLPAPEVFAPLYGADSAVRFRARAEQLGLDAVSAVVPNLADDIDTLDDLERLQLRCGPRTQAVLQDLPAGVTP
jgi:2-phospho-L-lactate guanylyltransferase